MTLTMLHDLFATTPRDHTWTIPDDAPTRRPDVLALMILDLLVPGSTPGTRLLGCATRDEVWLDLDVDALAAAATPDKIILLIQCGVCYDPHENRLFLFV